MNIKYKDRGLDVSYLQIFLREFFNLTLKKIVPRKASEPPYWVISSNDPLQVTGYYNTDTYAALALYMAYNYPNEGFPVKWVRKGSGSGGRIQWVIEEIFTPLDPDNGIYQRELIEDPDYEPDSDDLSEEEISRLKKQSTLIKAISSNIENFAATEERSIEIPERILSYIHDEVVTPSSSPEEIVRIKKLLYDKIGVKGFLEYTDKLFKYIMNVQKSFIESHTINGGTVELPPQFKDFKVTGYVDPWTEVILKGGYENG